MAITHKDFAADTKMLDLSGPLNHKRSAEVVQTLKEIVDQGIKRIIINMEQVTVMDSRGLAALVTGYKIFGGDPQNFQLVVTKDQPRLVFELTGFDRIFQIFDSLTKVSIAV